MHSIIFTQELESWTSDFSLPSSVWLSGFFNPQSFLTAIMQVCQYLVCNRLEHIKCIIILGLLLLSTFNYSQMNIRQIFYIYRKYANCPFSLISQSTARKNELPLDRMSLACDVTKKVKEEMQSPPREGAYVHGLFMEGARSDIFVVNSFQYSIKISVCRFHVEKWNRINLNYFAVEDTLSLSIDF